MKRPLKWHKKTYDKRYFDLIKSVVNQERSLLILRKASIQGKHLNRFCVFQYEASTLEAFKQFIYRKSLFILYNSKLLIYIFSLKCAECGINEEIYQYNFLFFKTVLGSKIPNELQVFNLKRKLNERRRRKKRIRKICFQCCCFVHLDLAL